MMSVAGCPKTNNTVRCVTKLSRFHGCMQQIFIDDEPVDVDVMLQRKWGRYAEVLMGTCGITDRCVCMSKYFSEKNKYYKKSLKLWGQIVNNLNILNNVVMKM